jgi:hypothetical protein
MRRVLRTLLPISVFPLAVFAFLAIPTIASAHGGNNDPNVVHACIGNVSKIVRIVGLSGVCLSSPPLVAETPAHWDIQGLPGAPGVNGTNGTNGAPGINWSRPARTSSVSRPTGKSSSRRRRGCSRSRTLQGGGVRQRS